jgi:hypothetical protein
MIIQYKQIQIFDNKFLKISLCFMLNEVESSYQNSFIRLRHFQEYILIFSIIIFQNIFNN